MDRIARIAVEAIRKRYDNGYRGEGKVTYAKMYKDIGALLVAFDAAQTTVEGLEEKLGDLARATVRAEKGGGGE